MGIDPISGGTTRSVKGLCGALSNAGENVSLLVLHGRHSFENAGRINVIYGHKVDVDAYDIVHLHGLWDPALHGIVKKCRAHNIPYIISPRGMLDPWSLSVKKVKKKLAMLLYQERDLKCAVAFHATAVEEAEHIRRLGFTQPIVIAANGVAVPTVMPEKSCGNSLYTHTAIFLSRLHPGKGLLTLAKAWARVRPIGWRMLIVGPDTYGHKKQVISLLNQLGITQQWQFVDHLDDVRKWDAYRAADLLIHPSVSENFGITIVEGLAAGLPVIATKGAPWSELEERKCGWWIDIGVEPLVKALKDAFALNDMSRAEMGERGRALVAEKYTWDAVVKAMITGYKEVLNGRP